MELRFWDTDANSRNVGLELFDGSTTCANERWYTLTCALSWKTKGLWTSDNALEPCKNTTLSKNTPRNRALVFHNSAFVCTRSRRRKFVLYTTNSGGNLRQRGNHGKIFACDLPQTQLQANTRPFLEGFGGCGNPITSIDFTASDAGVLVACGPARTIAQWDIHLFRDKPFATMKRQKKHRKVIRALQTSISTGGAESSKLPTVELGGAVEVWADGFIANEVLPSSHNSGIWLWARVVKLHTNNSATVRFAETYGIQDERHVPTSFLRSASEMPQLQPRIPGHTVYPSVLKALRIGHNFDKSAKLVCTYLICLCIYICLFSNLAAFM